MQSHRTLEKKNCSSLKKRNDQGTYFSLIVETCLSATISWVVDIGATNHVSNSLQGFLETRQLSNGEIIIFMQNATKVTVVVVGYFNLSFDSNRIFHMKDCFYVPNFKKNLISNSKFILNNGYSILFDDKVVIKINKDFISIGSLVGNLYVINHIYNTAQMEILNTLTNSNKIKESLQVNQTYLWHLRLGHINLRRIQMLVSDC